MQKYISCIQKREVHEKGINKCETTRWGCDNCVIVVYGNHSAILQIKITVGEVKPLWFRWLVFSPRIEFKFYEAVLDPRLLPFQSTLWLLYRQLLTNPH